jgi:hypothetical protein
MAGLTGKPTSGVGADIVVYMRAVAEFFGTTIHVTSGYRSADGQALAMFENWVKMKHGACYKNTIGHNNWKKLDDWFNSAMNEKATAEDRNAAKADFLKLAKDKMGSRSRHTTGRALDVAKNGITPAVYKAITIYLHDVPEGNRNDIYHFESVHQVPEVTADIKAMWEALKVGKPHNYLLSLPPGVVMC